VRGVEIAELRKTCELDVRTLERGPHLGEIGLRVDCKLARDGAAADQRKVSGLAVATPLLIRTTEASSRPAPCSYSGETTFWRRA